MTGSRLHTLFTEQLKVSHHEMLHYDTVPDDRMNILFLSAHAFLPTTRKTSVHFVSEALAERGHTVETISVGYSHLSYFKKGDLYRQFTPQKNRFVERAPRYRSACYLPPLHPFSSGSRLLDRIMPPFFWLYGNVLPRFMKKAIQRADSVAIESGTAIAFFDAVHRINPAARTLYFARDRLDTVGACTYLQKLERRIAPLFNSIVVPSARMATQFPPGTRVAVVPQGIDKAGFDAATVSPYAAGSKNAIAVGNILFDRKAVIEMARAAPEIGFHLFGTGIPRDFPENVRVYGERSFSEIIPYIKFADFGLAPYRLSERELYLAESSLKMQQYSYCLLPILAPDLMEDSRANIVAYVQETETDWSGKVRKAATMLHDPIWREDILTWDEVANRIEAELDRFEGAQQTAQRPAYERGD